MGLALVHRIVGPARVVVTAGIVRRPEVFAAFVLRLVPHLHQTDLRGMNRLGFLGGLGLDVELLGSTGIVISPGRGNRKTEIDHLPLL